MVETRHPDVYPIERPALPRVVGVGTSTGALIGYCKKGQINKPTLVTSFSQFISKFGSYYKSSPLVNSAKGFFDQGGSRLYIVRVVGPGSAKSEKDFANMAEVGTPAVAVGSVDLSTPVDLSVKKYLNLSIDNSVAVDIDLSAGAVDPAAVTSTEILANLNAAYAASSSVGVGSLLSITSPTSGLTSEVEIGVAGTPGVVATFTGSGFDGTSLNDGNKELVLNIDGIGDVTVDLSGVAGFVGAGPSTVVVADVVAEINSAIDAALGYGGPAGPYATVASVDGGEIKLDGVVTGPSGSIVIKDAPAGTSARLEVFGIPEGTGDSTFLGSTTDAVTIVMGLAEGSTYTYNGTEASPLFMKIEALSVGEHGNNVSITTQRWSATTTEILGASDDSVAISTILSAKVGDIVEISDGVTTIVRHINEIDVSTKEIKFLGSPNGASPIASGATVKCSTSQKVRTELDTAIISGVTTEAKLLTSAPVTPGVRLVLDDQAGAVTTIVVKSVNGSIISFDPVATSFPVGTIVSSIHFNLTIKVEGEIVETITFLSPEDTNTTDFFEKRLSGDSNESQYITATSLPAVFPDPFYSAPDPVVDVLLLGGLDGTLPSSSDYVGTESPATGMYTLEENEEFVMFSFPGVTDVFAQRAATAFAERLGRVMFITETPLVDDLPEEALNFRERELAISSSYVALYYPWIKIQDPESSNAEALITVPPSGHVQGVWSEVAQSRGIHKAPAGIADGALFTALGLTHETKNGEQDLLNDSGINAIRFFRSNGVVIWGTRTLWTLRDGFEYITTRRLINFIKESMRIGNQFAVFEPNDPILWRRLTVSNTEFLTNLWLRGMLFPSNNIEKAFFFLCNEETNPIAEIKKGRVNSLVGVNVPIPAEFIIFSIGLTDSGQADIREAFGLSGL